MNDPGCRLANLNIMRSTNSIYGESKFAREITCEDLMLQAFIPAERITPGVEAAITALGAAIVSSNERQWVEGEPGVFSLGCGLSADEPRRIIKEGVPVEGRSLQDSPFWHPDKCG